MDINNINNDIIDFGDGPKKDIIIKVIGVGGGGGNAVNHMYKEGIHDVSFAVCNTDAQALDASPVPVHVQLGREGLGAGNKPEKACAAAEESIEDIRRMLNDGTRMTFITAGMGGGTGTGAAPVVARESMAAGILTVGIVTIPFKFEGKFKIDQALDGVEELAKNVDALLVINNERLCSIYSNLSMQNAFAKADDTLSIAAKSIAEIITVHGDINLDFNDVKTVLQNGGVAVMSTGYGEGEGRVGKAIKNALDSPLLNDKDVFNSKKVLISFTHCGDDGESKGLMMEEMSDVTEFMDKFTTNYELKWGIACDPSLGDKVKVTILATGFGVADIQSEFGRKPTVEDINKRNAEQEEKDKKDRRRENYYGNDNDGLPKKKNAKCYIFEKRDLDDEDIISAVENSATYCRTSLQLESITRSSQSKVVKIDVTPQAAAPEEKQQEAHDGVIRFE